MTLLLLASLVLAQEPRSPSWETRLQRFWSGIDSPKVEERIKAVADLAASGDARAVQPLCEVLARSRERELSAEAQLDASARRPGDERLTRARAAARAALEERLATDRRFAATLIQSLVLAVSRLPKAEAERAIGPVVERALQGTTPGHRLPFVEALADLPGYESLKALTRLLEDPDTSLRTATTLALRRMGEGPFRAVAVSMLIARLQDSAWEVRASAVSVLRGLKELSAVPELARMLAREPGRLREDAFEALRHISGGEELGPVAAVWLDWWERFSGRPAGERPVAYQRTGTTFYGIESFSDRVVFVIDKSGSMAAPSGSPRGSTPGPPPGGGRKIDVACAELKKALVQLPETGTFNLIFYDGSVQPWYRSMVKATRDRKAEANSFADSRIPQGATNIFDALMRAFAMAGRGSHDDAYAVGVDTIFLLTDGQPTAGAVVQTGAILDEVRRINRLRRIKIHCIGIGDTDANFLRTLAAESGGTYVAK